MARQNKTTTASPVRGPLARKLLTKFRGLMHQKVVDLGAWRDGKRIAEAIDASLIGRDKLGEFDPLHGLFIFAQQRLSALVGQLSALPELRKLTGPVVQAEDEYMPSGPPISPLTQSYFFCWSALDLTAGPKRESFASIAVDLYRQFGLDPYSIQLFSGLERSRMGIYVHQGQRAGRIVLRELITDREQQVICPASYMGSPNEVWYVRLFDWPFDIEGPDYSVVVTTPYVVLPIGPAPGSISGLGTAPDWAAYLDRMLPQAEAEERKAAYANLMKYGPSRNYWNEYVFQAYVNHRKEVVRLTGIPDRPQSLPHGT